MPIVKITGQGLSAIALSVALLWTCLLGSRLMAWRAEAGLARSLHEIELLKKHNRPRPLPVSAPFPDRHRRPRSVNV